MTLNFDIKFSSQFKFFSSSRKIMTENNLHEVRKLWEQIVASLVYLEILWIALFINKIMSIRYFLLLEKLRVKKFTFDRNIEQKLVGRNRRNEKQTECMYPTYIYLDESIKQNSGSKLFLQSRLVVFLINDFIVDLIITPILHVIWRNTWSKERGKKECKEILQTSMVINRSKSFESFDF